MVHLMVLWLTEIDPIIKKSVASNFKKNLLSQIEQRSF